MRTAKTNKKGQQGAKTGTKKATNARDAPIEGAVNVCAEAVRVQIDDVIRERRDVRGVDTAGNAMPATRPGRGCSECERGGCAWMPPLEGSSRRGERSAPTGDGEDVK